jgi:hypothetical protein
MAGIFLILDLFCKEKSGGLGCGSAQGTVHGGLRIEEVAVAHRSSCSRLDQAMGAHREVGRTERAMCRSLHWANGGDEAME